MSELLVFEDGGWRNLLPLVYPRASFELRCGVDSLHEKIEHQMRGLAALVVRPDLADVIRERFGAGSAAHNVNPGDTDRPRLLVNGRLLLRETIELPLGSAAWQGETLLAAHVQSNFANKLTADVLLDAQRTREVLAAVPREELPRETYQLIEYPWNLVHPNAAELMRQLPKLPGGRAGKVHSGAQLVNEPAVAIEAGATIKPGAVLDAEDGPIRICAGAMIHPNATILGPAYIGPNCVVHPGALLRGGVSLGQWCKVGGEIEGSILHGYANKQHHGFLGHAYVCEWVNLGAGTTNSDLKNTYGTVRVPINGVEVETGELFVGSFIGDHAKTGINATLPTGCVIGFAANVLTNRIAPKFVPSFTWLTDERTERYAADRAMTVAKKVMTRRKTELSVAGEALFNQIAKIESTIRAGSVSAR